VESTEDPLIELADIHLPGAVPFWPPAPGWWLLAALVLAGLVFAGVLLFRRWQRQQKLAMALREVQQVRRLYTTWQQSREDAGKAGLALLHGCNSVLKRVALVHYPEQEVASLNGPAWLRFLDRTGKTTEFSKGSARVLGDGGYRRAWQTDDATAEALMQTVQDWIKRQYHNAPASAAAAEVPAQQQSLTQQQQPPQPPPPPQQPPPAEAQA
jgi:hypothetical protein